MLSSSLWPEIVTRRYMGRRLSLVVFDFFGKKRTLIVALMRHLVGSKILFRNGLIQDVH